MNENIKRQIELARSSRAVVIDSADCDCDRWYELFVIHDDGSSESMESAKVFDEITPHLQKYIDEYGVDNVEIDIWENEMCPKPIASLLGSPLKLPRMLPENIFGHDIEVTITRIDNDKFTDEVPICIVTHIRCTLDQDKTFGEFNIIEDGKRYMGHWRVSDTLSANLLSRLYLWVNNYGIGEGVTRELLHAEFGSRMGDHYYEKWEFYRHDILRMMGYFGAKSNDGQQFCRLILLQLERYERRLSDEN